MRVQDLDEQGNPTKEADELTKKVFKDILQPLMDLNKENKWMKQDGFKDDGKPRMVFDKTKSRCYYETITEKTDKDKDTKYFVIVVGGKKFKCCELGRNNYVVDINERNYNLIINKMNEIKEELENDSLSNDIANLDNSNFSDEEFTDEEETLNNVEVFNGMEEYKTDNYHSVVSSPYPVLPNNKFESFEHRFIPLARWSQDGMIPDEMKKSNNWVCWKMDWKEDNATNLVKLGYQPLIDLAKNNPNYRFDKFKPTVLYYKNTPINLLTDVNGAFMPMPYINENGELEHYSNECYTRREKKGSKGNRIFEYDKKGIVYEGTFSKVPIDVEASKKDGYIRLAQQNNSATWTSFYSALMFAQNHSKEKFGLGYEFLGETYVEKTNELGEVLKDVNGNPLLRSMTPDEQKEYWQKNYSKKGKIAMIDIDHCIQPVEIDGKKMLRVTPEANKTLLQLGMIFSERANAQENLKIVIYDAKKDNKKDKILLSKDNRKAEDGFDYNKISDIYFDEKNGFTMVDINEKKAPLFLPYVEVSPSGTGFHIPVELLSTEKYPYPAITQNQRSCKLFGADIEIYGGLGGNHFVTQTFNVVPNCSNMIFGGSEKETNALLDLFVQEAKKTNNAGLDYTRVTGVGAIDFDDGVTDSYKNYIKSLVQEYTNSKYPNASLEIKTKVEAEVLKLYTKETNLTDEQATNRLRGNPHWSKGFISLYDDGDMIGADITDNSRADYVLARMIISVANNPNQIKNIYEKSRWYETREGKGRNVANKFDENRIVNGTRVPYGDYVITRALNGCVCKSAQYYFEKMLNPNAKIVPEYIKDIGTTSFYSKNSNYKKHLQEQTDKALMNEAKRGKKFSQFDNLKPSNKVNNKQEVKQETKPQQLEQNAPEIVQDDIVQE